MEFFTKKVGDYLHTRSPDGEPLRVIILSTSKNQVAVEIWNEKEQRFLGSVKVGLEDNIADTLTSCVSSLTHKPEKTPLDEVDLKVGFNVVVGGVIIAHSTSGTRAELYKGIAQRAIATGGGGGRVEILTKLEEEIPTARYWVQWRDIPTGKTGAVYNEFNKATFGLEEAKEVMRKDKQKASEEDPTRPVEWAVLELK